MNSGISNLEPKEIWASIAEPESGRKEALGLREESKAPDVEDEV